MKSRPDNDKKSPEYFVSYDSDATTKLHGTRTAEKHASWFLPYLKPGMVLLDCGSGSGSITVGLAKAVAPGKVIGTDISTQEIERARTRADQSEINNISFETGDICKLSFSDNSFDAIFSHNVLEHVSEPGVALQEMKRVLKPGGVIGVRDADLGGFLFAPDGGMLAHALSILEEVWKHLGGDPRIGRRLGALFYDAGFEGVKISASYEYYNDPDGCRLIAESYTSAYSETHYVEYAIANGLARKEELESMNNAYRVWCELSGAFHARSHCEAIGWKA